MIKKKNSIDLILKRKSQYIYIKKYIKNVEESVKVYIV